MSFGSIRWRLMLALVVVLALATATTAGLTYRAVLAETEALFDYQLSQMALSLRDQGAIAPDEARALADEQLDFVVQIWTVDGRSIYASRLHPTLPARAVLGLADVNVNGEVWRTFGVASEGRVIQVAQPERIRSRLAAQAALHSVAPLAWLALPLLLVLWWVLGLLTRPLRKLAADVQQRDAVALGPLPEAGLPDEVRPLVSALNALLMRLGDSLATQRAFVADAAHELRSPLTALKLQLRVLQAAPDAAARDEALAALAAGIERSARLVEQLLALARSEPGPAGHPAPLDLAAVARDALADLWPLAQARQIRLSLEAPQPLRLDGDRAGLFALVRNLVDNALRYGREGGQVMVALALQGDGSALLTVDDDGPGIPPEDRARAFDRFWRRDPGQGDGAGLGLAIAAAVARRHGASITLADSPLGGLRVQVKFSLQTDDAGG